MLTARTKRRSNKIKLELTHFYCPRIGYGIFHFILQIDSENITILSTAMNNQRSFYNKHHIASDNKIFNKEIPST